MSSGGEQIPDTQDLPPLHVLVLGVHRSGTSAVTRAVNLLGIPTCRNEDLSTGVDNNARGSWECMPLMHLDNELLACLGGTWQSPPRSVRPLDPRLLRRRRRARDLVRSTHPTPQWVWKDPRACSLLPFWRQVLDPPVVGILVLRDPVEVAESLSSRPDRFPRENGLALWERSMRSLLRDGAGMPAFVTRYDDLLADPPAWCKAAGSFLEAQRAHLHPDVPALCEFLEPELRHHRRATDDSGPALSPQQHELWRLSLELLGAHDRFPRLGLPSESPTTSALLEARHRAGPSLVPSRRARR
jgi:hypothetical protein